MSVATWINTHPDGATQSLLTAPDVRYYAMASTGMRPQATEANAQIQAKSPGSLSNLAGRLIANSGFAAVLRTRKNGANGNQVVTWTGGATGYLEDTTNTDSVADDDLICYQANKTIAPNTCRFTIMQINFTATDTNDTCVRFACVGWHNLWSSPTEFGALSEDEALDQQLTEEARQVRVPTPMTFDALQVHLSVNSRGGVTARFRKNGANGNQVVTTAGTSIGFTEDTTNTDTADAGDLVNYSIIGGTSGGGSNTITCDQVSMECHNDDGRFMLIISSEAGGFQPTVDPSFYPVGGGGGVEGRATESEVSLELNCGDVVVSKMWLYDPVGSTGGYVTLRSNAADTALRCGPLDAGLVQSYQDLVNTVAAATGDDLAFEVVGVAGGLPTFSTIVMQVAHDRTKVHLLGGTVLGGNIATG